MSTPDFSELAPLMEEWALETSEARMEKRLTSKLEALKAFHDAVAPRAGEIIEFLDQYALDEIPEEHHKLIDLLFMAVEVDDPVNKWNAVVQPASHDPRDWRIKTSFTDFR